MIIRQVNDKWDQTQQLCFVVVKKDILTLKFTSTRNKYVIARYKDENERYLHEFFYEVEDDN